MLAYHTVSHGVAGHRGKKSSEWYIEWMIYGVSSELGTMGIIMGDGIQSTFLG
jgi:hypothetical protein